MGDAQVFPRELHFGANNLTMDTEMKQFIMTDHVKVYILVGDLIQSV